MRAGRGPRGEVPPAGLSAFCGGRGFASGPIGVAAHTAPARHRGASRYRRGIVPCGPLRVLGHCPAGRSDEGAFPRPGGSADGGACATSADRGAGGPPGGASLPGGPSFGRCAPARFCAVCAPCNQSWCFRWLSLRGGLVGGRLSFVMRRFPIRIFVGHRKRLCGL